MKKLVFVMICVASLLMTQGCAVYPHTPSISVGYGYPGNYGYQAPYYQSYGYNGWRGGHRHGWGGGRGWNGGGWGGHGWRHGGHGW